MTNSLDAQSLFRNSPEYLEKYQVALENVAGQFNQMVSDPVFFDTQIKPNLTDDKAVRFYFYKRFLSDMLIFDNHVKLNIAKLGMASAAFGETPRLTLSIDTEGKLERIPESDILQTVTQQFNDNNLLIQVLNQNIFKISVLFN